MPIKKKGKNRRVVDSTSRLTSHLRADRYEGPAFSPAAAEGTAETDSPLERTGFELLVPLTTEKPLCDPRGAKAEVFPRPRPSAALMLVSQKAQMLPSADAGSRAGDLVEVRLHRQSARRAADAGRPSEARIEPAFKVLDLKGCGSGSGAAERITRSTGLIENGTHCCILLTVMRRSAPVNSPRGSHILGDASMRRRDLLNAAAAATFAAGVAPRLGRGADRAKTLVFVGVADLSILDPVVAGARPTRNSAYLVFDTLYGINTEWKAQPQMVEGHTVEEDGLNWTLKLRDGLRFHDKEPVLARDVVASIRRFAPRVIFANALMDGDRRVVGARRPHRAVSLEAAVPAFAGGARRPRRQRPGDHAGAPRGRSRRSSLSPKSSAAAPTVS